MVMSNACQFAVTSDAITDDGLPDTFSIKWSFKQLYLLACSIKADTTANRHGEHGMSMAAVEPCKKRDLPAIKDLQEDLIRLLSCPLVIELFMFAQYYATDLVKNPCKSQQGE